MMQKGHAMHVTEAIDEVLQTHFGFIDQKYVYADEAAVFLSIELTSE